MSSSAGNTRRLALPVVMATSFSMMLGACASSVGPSAGAPAATSARSSSIPTVSPRPTPTPSPTPAATALKPTAVVPLKNVSDAIPVTTDGRDLWVGVNGGIVKVDGSTNKTSRFTADMRTGNGTVAYRDGVLWLSDYSGGKVERVDPSTGTVLTKADVSGPVEFVFPGDGVWVGSEKDVTMMRLDPRTAKVTSTIAGNSRMVAGMGELWHGSQPGEDPAVTEVDPATGADVAATPVPQGSQCTVTGSFPDNVWAGCTPFQSGGSADAATVVRIDPKTHTVVTSVTLPGFLDVVVVNGFPWFLVPSDGSDGPALSLYKVDPATGQVLAVRDLGSLDPNAPVVTDNAVWIPDQAGQRLVRLDASTLT